LDSGEEFILRRHVAATYTAERHPLPNSALPTVWRLLEEVDSVLDLETLMRKGFKSEVESIHFGLGRIR
jgi:hypothetical protein